jgi:signal transduction histidine kinase
VGAIEYLAEVLATSEHDGRGDDFYGRLSEATTRVTSLRRAVIFRYDYLRRHVRLAGAHGIDLDEFEAVSVTLESAPIARRALQLDRVIEGSATRDGALAPGYAERFDVADVVCAPMAARGRWIGVILGDREPGSPPLDESERELLWILGKTAALASMARVATRQREKALRLEHRIDLARELHEGVVQRLFGVSLALSGNQPLDAQTRTRCAEEIHVALADLRTAVSRPLGSPPAPGDAGLAAELERLRGAYPQLTITEAGGLVPAAPQALEGLAQAVLGEAVRNAAKHAGTCTVEVRAGIQGHAFVLEVLNDGLVRQPRRMGLGLRLAGTEALHAGGMLEFGPAADGRWRLRLVVYDAVPGR